MGIRLLLDDIYFGNGLNLISDAPDSEEHRASGPNRRVSVPHRDQLAEAFQRWVSDPQRYTEVAETLASIVSELCDSRHGADGWRAVADQWLSRPASIAMASPSPTGSSIRAVSSTTIQACSAPEYHPLRRC